MFQYILFLFTVLGMTSVGSVERCEPLVAAYYHFEAKLRDDYRPWAYNSEFSLEQPSSASEVAICYKGDDKDYAKIRKQYNKIGSLGHPQLIIFSLQHGGDDSLLEMYRLLVVYKYPVTSQSALSYTVEKKLKSLSRPFSKLQPELGKHEYWSAPQSRSQGVKVNHLELDFSKHLSREAGKYVKHVALKLCFPDPLKEWLMETFHLV